MNTLLDITAFLLGFATLIGILTVIEVLWHPVRSLLRRSRSFVGHTKRKHRAIDTKRSVINEVMSLKLQGYDIAWGESELETTPNCMLEEPTISVPVYKRGDKETVAGWLEYEVLSDPAHFGWVYRDVE